jgi:hypothetical protein
MVPWVVAIEAQVILRVLMFGALGYISSVDLINRDGRADR